MKWLVDVALVFSVLALLGVAGCKKQTLNTPNGALFSDTRVPLPAEALADPLEEDADPAAVSQATASTAASASVSSSTARTPQASSAFEMFLARFVSVKAETLCRTAFECPSVYLGENEVEILGRWGTRERCEQGLLAELRSGLQNPTRVRSVVRSIAEGRASFHAQTADDCLAAYERFGQNCVYDPLELVNDFCDNPVVRSPLDDACRGVVRPLLDAESNAECTNAFECRVGHCLPKTRASPDALRCVEWSALCDGSITGSPDMDCARDDDCNAFLTCGRRGVCEPMRRAGRGAACSLSEGPLCNARFACVDGRCASPPTYGSAGAGCDGSFKRCQAGVVCSADEDAKAAKTQTKTCVPLREQGDACGSSLECPHDLYCSGSSATPGVCLPPGVVGEACDYDAPIEFSECGPHLHCALEGNRAACAERELDDESAFDLEVFGAGYDYVARRRGRTGHFAK